MIGIELIRARKISDEAARECIARAGWIEHLLEREAGREEREIAREQNRAMLALLDHHHRWTAFLNPACGAQQVVITGQLSGLAVIDHQQIDTLEQTQQIVALALYPEVHGVARNELRLLHLLQHIELQ